MTSRVPPPCATKSPDRTLICCSARRELLTARVAHQSASYSPKGELLTKARAARQGELLTKARVDHQIASYSPKGELLTKARVAHQGASCSPRRELLTKERVAHQDEYCRGSVTLVV